MSLYSYKINMIKLFVFRRYGTSPRQKGVRDGNFKSGKFS